MGRIGVVGLGTAGAAVARACARRGVRVVGLERGSLEEAGARWVNGVPRWVFTASGLADPTPPELRGAEGPYHLVAGWGPARTTSQSGLEVDMRHLGARLRREAVAAGAELRGEVRVTGIEGRVAHTSEGPIEADGWIDATGYRGLSLLGVPALPTTDLCAAAQQVHQVVDDAGAAAFLAAHRATSGEPVCFTSVAGGYSIVNVRVHGGEVGLLTGSVPGTETPSGSRLLRDFVARHPWIGPAVFGGTRVIPLRRPWEGLARTGPGWWHAAVGDAAGLVYPAHGSGIAMQLLTARWLADALAEGQPIDAWNVRVQRELGGRLAASDLFRRFSQQAVDADVLATLIRRRVIGPGMMEDTLLQLPVRPQPRPLARALVGLVREPALARRLGPVLLRMRLAEQAWARYPAGTADRAAWAAWARRATGLAPWFPPTATEATPSG